MTVLALISLELFVAELALELKSAMSKQSSSQYFLSSSGKRISSRERSGRLGLAGDEISESRSIIFDGLWLQHRVGEVPPSVVHLHSILRVQHASWTILTKGIRDRIAATPYSDASTSLMDVAHLMPRFGGFFFGSSPRVVCVEAAQRRRCVQHIGESRAGCRMIVHERQRSP